MKKTYIPREGDRVKNINGYEGVVKFVCLDTKNPYGQISDWIRYEDGEWDQVENLSKVEPVKKVGRPRKKTPVERDLNKTRPTGDLTLQNKEDLVSVLEDIVTNMQKVSDYNWQAGYAYSKGSIQTLISVLKMR